jgi:hypothetical protein
MTSWDAERLEVVEAVRNANAGSATEMEWDPARVAACADLLRNAVDTLGLETGKWNEAGTVTKSGNLRLRKTYAAF